jgi:predicted TIM-barrel fold metal-dependent hydrolase
MMSLADLAPNKATPTYDGPIFDGDTHVRENADNWKRVNEFLPEKYRQDWAVTWRPTGDGNLAMFIGEKRVEASVGYKTEDGRVSPPGKLKEWLRAIKEGNADVDMRVPTTPDMHYRDDRIKKLDEWDIDGSIMFLGDMVGTFGYLNDPEPTNALVHAYNQWMNESWGFNYKDRWYATPILNLLDIDASIKEAEWAISQGLRVAAMPMGPVGGRSPADPYFDRFWAVLNAAGVSIAFHVSEAAYMHAHMQVWGEELLVSRQRQSAFTWMHCYSERPVVETLSSFIYYNFFERFPNVKLVSVENGAEWVPSMLVKMDKSRGMAKNGYWPCGQLKQRPSTIFKENVFVVAYPEDDVAGIIERAGTSKFLLMGSDYPHAEGVPTPREFVAEALRGVSPADVEAIMFSNGRRFLPKSA